MAPKKDPANFQFRKQSKLLLIKRPGELQGSGFYLQGCEGSEIYLLDHTSQVMVDDCFDCKIFIGPCGGSVFLRDCKRCTVVVACRQFRTRDCEDLDVSLYCSTQPSIETSSGITFGPWRGAYPHALEHFAAAKLDLANNSWSKIFDFNAGEEVHGHVQHWQVSHAPRPLWVPPAAALPSPGEPGSEPVNPVPGFETINQLEEVGTVPLPSPPPPPPAAVAESKEAASAASPSAQQPSTPSLASPSKAPRATAAAAAAAAPAPAPTTPPPSSSSSSSKPASGPSSAASNPAQPSSTTKAKPGTNSQKPTTTPAPLSKSQLPSPTPPKSPKQLSPPAVAPRGAGAGTVAAAAAVQWDLELELDDNDEEEQQVEGAGSPNKLPSQGASPAAAAAVAGPGDQQDAGVVVGPLEGETDLYVSSPEVRRRSLPLPRDSDEQGGKAGDAAQEWGRGASVPAEGQERRSKAEEAEAEAKRRLREEAARKLQAMQQERTKRIAAKHAAAATSSTTTSSASTTKHAAPSWHDVAEMVRDQPASQPPTAVPTASTAPPSKLAQGARHVQPAGAPGMLTLAPGAQLVPVLIAPGVVGYAVPLDALRPVPSPAHADAGGWGAPLGLPAASDAPAAAAAGAGGQARSKERMREVLLNLASS